MVRTKEFQEGGHSQSGEPREAARPKDKHSTRPRNKARELGVCRGAWANSLWHQSDGVMLNCGVSSGTHLVTSVKTVSVT